MITLDVDPDCITGGYSVVVAFSSAVPDESTWTLYRYDDVGRSVVRGAVGQTVAGTGIASVVDYEAPISSFIAYQVVVSDYGNAEVTVPPLIETCPAGQYLRDLLDPDVHFTTSFCLGVLESTESTVRSGVYSVLGRPAPIVVVDTRETETGVLRFISRTREELRDLRAVLSRGTPMLLQVEKEYDLGRNGVLYFQPSSFVDRWALPNAKIPQHVIEVNYTVIDAPSYTTIFFRYGIPFDLDVNPSGEEITDGPLTGRTYCQGGLLQRFPTYDALFASGLTYAETYYQPDTCTPIE